MKLFSKRHTYPSPRHLEERRLASPRLQARKAEMLSNEARNRLISEIKFVSSNDDFLEKFILSENESEGMISFDVDKLNNFSLAELGYSLTDYFGFDVFKMKKSQLSSRYTDESEEFYEDSKLFDLAEIAILFSQPSQRIEVIRRFNIIFSEEDTNFQIIEHLITKKSGDTLRTLSNVLKDENLSSKIRAYFDFEVNGDHVNTAKLSAEIVNILFSGAIKEDKPQEIKKIKNKLVPKLLGEKADKEKVTRLEKYIDALLKTSRDLSNDVYDVRHTEKSTLEIKNENIYKLISRHNMSIVELVLTSLKDDYVLSDDWEVIKTEYIKKYKIDRNDRLTITKSEDSIDLDSISF